MRHPVFHNLRPVCADVTCKMNVSELCSGHVFSEVTDERKGTRVVRKDLILTQKVSIRHAVGGICRWGRFGRRRKLF